MSAKVSHVWRRERALESMNSIRSPSHRLGNAHGQTIHSTKPLDTRNRVCFVDAFLRSGALTRFPTLVCAFFWALLRFALIRTPLLGLDLPTPRIEKGV